MDQGISHAEMRVAPLVTGPPDALIVFVVDLIWEIELAVAR
jgi:hypothetical protein